MTANYNKTDVGLLKCPESLTIDTLTPLLQKAVKQFTDKELELQLYSVVTVSSALLTKVTGIYDRRRIYPMLYFFVIALPASGKGIMMYAKDLIHLINDYYKKESDKNLKQYRSSLKGKGAAGLLKPPYKVMIIPGNCTAAKTIQHLADNSPDTPSLIIESEMDSVNQSNTSEHFNQSDIYRKSYHHETVSMSRRSDDEYLTVESPKLAIVLSGTPGQVKNLIDNKEDGTLSRFMTMIINSVQDLRKVSPCPTCEDLTEYYKNLAPEFYKFWEWTCSRQLTIELTSVQWETLQDFLEKNYQEVTVSYGGYATSIVKRHGLILYRLCMVLTTLRGYENNISDATLTCSDDDFKIALYLVTQSLDATLEVYESLPGVKPHNIQKEKNISYLIGKLKEEFERADVLPIAKELKLSNRTIDRYLKELVERGTLEHPVAGKYIIRAKV